MNFRKSTAWVIVAVVLAGSAIAVGAVVRSGSGNGAAEPPLRDLDEIPQDAAAASQGVELEARGAVFSATETLVRIAVTVLDQDALDGIAGGHDILAIVPAHDGFAGPFASGQLHADAAGDEVIVTLPPITVDDSYDGSIPLTISALTVRTPNSLPRIDGQWLLTLQGPLPGELDEHLRLQHFESASFQVHGDEVRVEGWRSTSETVVELHFPPSLELITQPALQLDTGNAGPHRLEILDHGQRAAFAPTPFDDPIVLDPGTFIALPGHGETFTVTIDIGAALARSDLGAGGLGDFDISEDDVISGPAEIVLGGKRGYAMGSSGRRDWVAVIFDGNWPHETLTGPFVDGEGTEVHMGHNVDSYTKDEHGNIGPGQTEIGIFIDQSAALEQLTFTLGSQAAIAPGAGPVTLNPAE